MMISNGNSKLKPNTKSRLIKKPKYWSPDNAVTCTSLPTVSRKPSAVASTVYASTAPAMNSAAPTATKTTANRRSLAYNPGVMNAHSW